MHVEPEEPATENHGVMSWSPDEARVFGAMIEKSLATPQNYPLSLNALTLACNQTTNRDPIVAFDDRLVEAVLTEGKTKGLSRFVHPRSGRGVTKYRHVIDEALGIETPELALLSVLALRGPQSVGELRTRTERLHPFEDNTDVEATLSSFTDREGRPLVRALDRESGQRDVRWIQLLCPEQGQDRANQLSAPSPRAAAAADPGLRDEVDELRQELSVLRAEFEAFKAEFG